MLMSDLYEHYGTWEKLTRALKLSSNIHQHWKRIGYIPFTTQCIIHVRTEGFFKADEAHAENPKEKKPSSS